MTKFKVLKNNQTFVTKIAIFSNYFAKPNDLFESIFGYCLVVLIGAVLLANSEFVVKYYYDVKPALGAVKIFAAGFQAIGMFCGIKCKMTKVRDLQLELQQIVDEGEDNSEMHNIYWECEQKCRKNNQRLSYYIIFHNSIFPIVSVYALVCITFGNYNTSSFFLPWSMIVPFEGSIFGWFLKWFIQFSASICYAMCMTTVTSYFVSCCYYIYTMCNHYNRMVNSVTNDVEHMETVVKPRKVKEIREQIAAQLCDIVKFHIKIYEVFNMLKDIISLAICVLLPANVFLMSISLYDLEISVFNIEPSFLLFDVSCILCALFWPAFICYSASHATDRISSIGDTIYNSNWIKYPPALRKYVILMIARSQEPVYFSGLGLIRCSLEVFGKLCRTSSSYYMIFRAIERR